MSDFEASVLASLLAYPAIKALDSAWHGLKAVHDDKRLRHSFEAAAARAIADIEAEHGQSAHAFQEPRFLTDQAPIELHRLFTSPDGPDPRGLAELCRDYHGHVPGDIEIAAEKLIRNLRRELWKEPAFRPLIMAGDVAFLRERVPAIAESLAGLHSKLDRLAPVGRERGRDAIVPMQIPDPVADFQGREDALARIVDGLCREGGSAISAIHGMGGIGKTELGRRVAKALRALTTCGQINVDLLGTSRAPLTDLEAMAEIVRALDPQAPAPTTDTAAVEAYKQVLRDRRVLVLLDNARDGPQVKRLVEHKPASCLVLVTTRQTIGLPGLVRVPLEELACDEARALLRSEMGKARASDAQLRAIAERCGWLPLALRAAGRFLAEYESWPIDDYLADLADERKRLQRLRPEDDPSLNVAEVLSFSARQLQRDEPTLAARWQQLAVFPVGFDLAAAAAVWDIAPGEAQEALARLHRRSMVMYDEADHRWRLHDLMRDAALLSIGDQAQATLQARLNAARLSHARHYCGVLADANRLCKEGHLLIGLAIYDREQVNIAAGQAWASTRIEADSTAAQLTADFADAGYMILQLRLTPRVWICWLEAQRDACHGLGDRWGEADALGNMGSARCLLGEPGQGIELLDRALTIFQASGDRRREGAVLGNLGSAWLDVGYPRHAIRLHRQALAISREIGDRMAEGQDLANLGRAFLRLEKPLQAIEFLEPALTITRDRGDLQGEGKALGLLGSALVGLGERRRAVEVFREWLAIAREIGDLASQGNAMNNLGLTMHELNEREEAVRLVREAVAIYEQIGAKHFVDDARKRLAAWSAGE